MARSGRPPFEMKSAESRAVRRRGKTKSTLECAPKGVIALVPERFGDVRDGGVAFRQSVPRLTQSQILGVDGGRAPERLLEEPAEMPRRHEDASGEGLDGKILIE